MKFLIFLFLPFLTFAQQTTDDQKTDQNTNQKCEAKKITYSLQLQSTVSIDLFDWNKVDPKDSTSVEEICSAKGKYYRILIPQESKLFAEESKERYSKTFKDCFIVKYVDGKRYN